MANALLDRVLGRLTAQDSRRAVISSALGLLGASISGLQGEAKRKKKKKCRRGARRCGKKCFNLQSDNANCGACGAACSDGRVCANGVCGCPAGESLVQGVCIPRFGCTVQADACQVSQTNCPQRPDLQDAFCFVTPEGAPFCGDITACVNAIADCTPVAGKPRVLLSCPECPDVGNIGVCVLPVSG